MRTIFACEELLLGHEVIGAKLALQLDAAKDFGFLSRRFGVRPVSRAHSDVLQTTASDFRM